MAAELLFVVLLLRLNWQICSHCSEKDFRIQISKLWPPRSLEIFNENCTVHKMFLKKTDLCLPWPQKHFHMKGNMKTLNTPVEN